MVDKKTLEIFVKTVTTIFESEGNNTNLNSQWKWLEKFQESNDSWNICYEAMRMNISYHITYYSALILQSKIKQNIEYLSIDEQLKMTQFLLQFLREFKPHMRITHEICIGLATLTIYCNEIPEPLINMINELMQDKMDNNENNDGGFDQKDSYSKEKALIYFISEYSNLIHRAGSNRKENSKKEISRNSDKILKLLEYLISISSKDEQYLTKIIRSFGELSSLGPFNIDIILNSSIFIHVINVILYYESYNSHLVLTCNETFMDCIYVLKESTIEGRKQYFDMFIKFASSLTSKIEYAKSNDDIDYLHCVMDIYRSLLDVFYDEFLNCLLESNNIAILNNCINICEYKDFRLLINFMDFWYDLLQSQSDTNYIDISSLDYIKNYASILVKQIFQHLPVDKESINETLHTFDDDSLTHFRKSSKDTLQRLFCFINPQDYLNEIMILIHTPSSIEILEASLYFLSSICTYLKSDKQLELIKIVLSIPHNAPILLLETCCNLLCELSFYIAHEHSIYLQDSFNYVIQCLPCHALQISASASLRALLCKGHHILYIKLDYLISLLNSSLCAMPVDCFLVDSLTHCCAILIDNNENNTKIHDLIKLLNIHKENIKRLIQNQNTTSIQFYDGYDSLVVVFKCINNTNFKVNVELLNPLINEIFHLSFQILEKCSYIDNICEKVCRTMRFCLKFIGIYFIQIKTFAEQTIECFHKSQQSAFIYLSCIIIDIYFNMNQPDRQWVIDLYTIILKSSMDKMASGTLSPTDLTYFLEDTVRLCAKLFSHSPLLFIRHSLTFQIMRYITNGLIHDYKKTFKICINIIRDVLLYDGRGMNPQDIVAYKEYTLQLFNLLGALIIKNSVQNIFSRKPLIIVEQSGELVYSLCKSEFSMCKSVIIEETKQYVNNYNSVLVDEYIKKITSCTIDYIEASRITRKLSISLYGY